MVLVWRSIGPSWLHIRHIRIAERGIIFVATDLAVAVLQRLFGIEPSEKVLEAWDENNPQKAQQEFFSIAAEVLESDEMIPSRVYRRSIGLCGLARGLREIPPPPLH